jgi:hypothetical protein
VRPAFKADMLFARRITHSPWQIIGLSLVYVILGEICLDGPFHGALGAWLETTPQQLP